MEEPMKQKLKTRNIILISVLTLIQMPNLDLSDYLLTTIQILKNLRFLILQHTKKKVIKMYILVVSLFTG